uniref:Neuronal acetylcholine receptor subunit alpha-10 n=1 Tax=Ascaris suum TaxID=6253 RepID=F1KX45_ASCSU
MRVFGALLLSLIKFVVPSEGFVSKSRLRSKETEIDLKSNKGTEMDFEHDDFTIIESDAHSRLIGYIRRRARPFQRPVLHSHSPIDIHVRAALYQIVDLDQRNNLATLSAYFDVWWIDDFVKWNASQFDGITKTFIPARWIWKPEFYLYHSVQGRIPDYAPDATAEINGDGRLRMFIPVTSRALCPINVKYFPFDTQNCTFACGSWSYQFEFVKLLVEDEAVFLGDFYDNQEWLLENATLYNGTLGYLGNESFSTVYMELMLRRQSFYYVFNFVFPITLVSLVAIIGFHAPINATGRRESKFRLGIMTLLSMSVMLLMLVDEMKFALASIPGQRGSFSDVPLLGVFHMIQILIISVATCTSSVFVHLEKYALRNQSFHAIPWWLRFLTAEKLFCCYVPPKLRRSRREEPKRNNYIVTHSVNSSPENTVERNLIPTDVNFVECQQESAVSEMVLEGPPPITTQRIELLVSLMRQFIHMKHEMQRRHSLPPYWERVIRRLENLSLSTYLLLIGINVTMFMYPELWY